MSDTPATSSAPVFVMSAARSGSTMLSLTLGRIPGMISLPETNFWVFKERQASRDLSRPGDRATVADAWIADQKIGRWTIDLPRLRSDIAADGTTWRRIFELTVSRYSEDTGSGDPNALLWCEKSPPHVFRRDSILEDFPEARFIHLVRDPRAVASSLKHCSWATSNVYAAARLWRESAGRLVDRPDAVGVSYEEFVQDPDAMLQRISEFLGLRFDPSLMAVQSGFAGIKTDAGAAQAGGPVSAAGVDKWRKRLSKPDRDLAVIQHVCGDEMARRGYELLPAKRDLTFRLRLAHGWLGLLLTKLSR